MRAPHEASQPLCSQKDFSQVSWLPIWILGLRPGSREAGWRDLEWEGIFHTICLCYCSAFPIHVVFVKLKS